MAGVLAALSAFLAQALHLALMLAAAPLLTGLVRLLKARILGRRGPPLLQPYRDLWKLMRKQPVV
ncbi:MAG: formate hydrogenlyase, partial [Alphaproteobacteria bacterium]|nr:formate hydrogenlyase [Alphaproteobacteria bacterium]